MSPRGRHAALRAGNAPHRLQVFEVGTATMMNAQGAIEPVHQPMKNAAQPFDPKASSGPWLLEVRSALQGDSVRVAGAKGNDLHAANALFRKDIADLPLDLQNFRD